MLSDKSIRRDGKDNIFRRIIQKIRKKRAVRYRKTLNNHIRCILENVGPFTIFANNCIGGVFYHDAGRAFTSPLINTAMDGMDFLKFVENPKYYIDQEMEFFSWPGRNFPIARIDDVEVNFVHYQNKDECILKWKERSQRIVWDNIFIVATNHDGMYREECMQRFDKLPYKNKIMFVTKEYPEYEWAIPINHFKNRFQCRITTAFADLRGHRYYETAFDIATWIKENSPKDETIRRT